jgi:hypothetical protein
MADGSKTSFLANFLAPYGHLNSKGSFSVGPITEEAGKTPKSILGSVVVCRAGI